MGAVQVKEVVSWRKCCCFLCIQACWSVICRMWPRSCWDLLEESVEGLHHPTTRDYKPLSIKTSISGFDTPPSNDTFCPATTGLPSNPKAAELAPKCDEADSNRMMHPPQGDGDGDVDRQPKWVDEQDEPGMCTMRISFPGVKGCLRRIYFRKKWFEKQAEKWWDANKARVCQRYGAYEDERLKGDRGLYIKAVSFRGSGVYKFVCIGSSKGCSQQQVEQWWDANKSRLIQRYNLDDSVLMWHEKYVEQDEPGVYTSELPEDMTMRGIKFVRFSQSRFRERQPERWWDAKKAEVCQRYRYNVVDGDIHQVEWVERYGQGVSLRLVSFPGGVGKDIIRVCFSRKLYGSERAQQWWGANKSSVYQRYNVNVPTEGGGAEAEWVELDDEPGGGLYIKPVPVPGTRGLLVLIKPVPEQRDAVYVYLKLPFHAPYEQAQSWALLGPVRAGGVYVKKN